MMDRSARIAESPVGARGESERSILFLDDDETILASLRSLLQREGYTMHFFQSGPEALTFLEQHSVDIIVSDMRMPRMNGVEFLNLAAGVCPEAVRVMLSENEDKSVVVSALAKELAQHHIFKPWNDAGFKELLNRALLQQQELRKQQLAQVLESFTTLPSRPRFHARLRSMLSKGDKPLTVIVAEVEKIPALVARLLKVANSVYYSARKPVATVREAVTFIGTEYIGSLVTAVEAFQSISKGMDAKANHEVEVMWGLALRRASIAKMIGEMWEGVKDPHVPYVVSLLQDIGLVIRLCSEPEKYYRFKQLSSGGMSRYEADLRIFTTPHDELGAALLEYWNFPADIVHAVKNHHRRAGDNVLVQIIQIAEALGCYDPLNPHDPAIDALIPQWRENLGHELSSFLRQAEVK